jgi:hypothetical protein
MEFGEDETEILMGLRNQSVKIYDVKFRSVCSVVFCCMPAIDPSTLI